MFYSSSSRTIWTSVYVRLPPVCPSFFVRYWHRFSVFCFRWNSIKNVAILFDCIVFEVSFQTWKCYWNFLEIANNHGHTHTYILSKSITKYCSATNSDLHLCLSIDQLFQENWDIFNLVNEEVGGWGCQGVVVMVARTHIFYGIFWYVFHSWNIFHRWNNKFKRITLCNKTIFVFW